MQSSFKVCWAAVGFVGQQATRQASSPFAAHAGSQEQLQAVLGAIMQCLFLIYGVKLPGRNSDWAGGCDVSLTA